MSTIVCICRGEMRAFVVLREGEARFGALDMIFLVSGCGQTYSVAANQMSGVIRTLVRWGMLSDGEIADEAICETSNSARIRCAGCGEPQNELSGERFRQCRVCKERDGAVELPDFKGFYCGGECQRKDWARHKVQDH